MQLSKLDVQQPLHGLLVVDGCFRDSDSQSCPRPRQSSNTPAKALCEKISGDRCAVKSSENRKCQNQSRGMESDWRNGAAMEECEGPKLQEDSSRRGVGSTDVERNIK